jgi:hypothetical protein
MQAVELQGKIRFQGEQDDENKINTVGYNSPGFAGRPYWVRNRRIRKT